MKMKRISILALSFVSSTILLSGCGSKFVSTPINLSAKSKGTEKGLVYFAPKSIIEVTLRYSIYERKDSSKKHVEYFSRLDETEIEKTAAKPAANKDDKAAGTKEEKPTVTEKKSVDLKSIFVPDSKLAFSIDIDKLTSPAVATGGPPGDAGAFREKGFTPTYPETSTDEAANKAKAEEDTLTPLKISLSPNFTLKKIEASFDDRSAKILDELGKASIDVVKAGINFSAYGEKAAHRNIDLLGVLEIKKQIDPNKCKSPQSLSNNNFRNEVIAFVNSRGSKEINTGDTNEINRLCPEIRLVIDNLDELNSEYETQKDNAYVLKKNNSYKPIEGILVRSPFKTAVKVEAEYNSSLDQGTEVLYEDSLQLVQYGQLAALPISSSMFSRRISDVDFHSGKDRNNGDVGGGIQTFAFASTSGLKALSAELKKLGNDLIRTFSETIPTLALNTEKEIVDAEEKAVSAEAKYQGKQNELNKKIADQQAESEKSAQEKAKQPVSGAVGL